MIFFATCGVCGLKWSLTKSEFENRMKLSKSKKIFCGKDCSAKHLSELYEDERRKKRLSTEKIR